MQHQLMKQPGFYQKSNTIFALVTPNGKSGVAIIRISGSEACKLLTHFKITKVVKPRLATFVKLYGIDNQLIDEAIILYFPAPDSFTGEDVIELQVHGSRAVIQLLYIELSTLFRLAEPGEFSLRAFLNNKLDLTRAEAIADLIDSDTTMQAKQALRQMGGALEKIYEDLRNRLINIQANIEAYIDFPEDLDYEVLNNIDNQINELKAALKDHLDDNRRGERLREGLYVSIIGEPNAGKSTLLNCLAKRDVAIVSEYAGTTRDALEVHMDVGGYPITIVDTAGIRNSDNPIESEGIKKAINKANESDFKIALFPYQEKIGKLNQMIMELADDDTICVFSKADDSNDHEIKLIDNVPFLPISVHKTFGIDKLLELVRKKAEQKYNPDNSPSITSVRHRNHLQCTLDILSHINNDGEKSIELVSEDLRLAIRELGKVTGIITADDILNNIFSKFCLGK